MLPDDYCMLIKAKMGREEEERGGDLSRYSDLAPFVARYQSLNRAYNRG